MSPLRRHNPAAMSPLQSQVADILILLGWSIEFVPPFAGFAFKWVDTFNAPKIANLSWIGTRLAGSYLSEGRNVLAPVWMQAMSHDLPADEIRDRVRLFIDEVDQKIDASYARRLHLQ